MQKPLAVAPASTERDTWAKANSVMCAPRSPSCKLGPSQVGSRTGQTHQSPQTFH